MFCPKCKSMLRPRTERGKKVLGCSCGYIAKEGGANLRESVNSGAKSVDVVDESSEVLPQTDAQCPKCGEGTAYYWMIQTRAGDEPETKFLRCIACKHVWRDYG